MDRLLFRPLMGWATAWSFDCLRLWIERGIAPAVSLQRSLIHYTAVFLLSFLWIYHGLVPKLLFTYTGERELLGELGTVFAGKETAVLAAVGIGEILFGLLHWRFHRSRLLYYTDLAGLVLLLIGAAVSSPMVLAAPFNPVSLNVSMAGLALIALWTRKDLPRASRCRRSPGG
ncbi:DoxX-like family protein [Paenibacillus sp. CC-CFT747]|nr:DoxX-like family protein [Paenibacillus sp. CC-CFT747]